MNQDPGTESEAFSLAERIDQICTPFEAACKAALAGAPWPRIEDYLPSLVGSERECVLRELILLDVYHRQRRGETPETQDYQDRFPELDRAWLASMVTRTRLGLPAVATPDDATLHAGTGTIPQQLGEYRIVREVGRGGMGVVYEAIQESLGRHVALKVLPFNNLLGPTHLERFRREAQSAARLHHSNIVPVFGVGEHAGISYYAMQYIQGQGLDRVLREIRRLRAAERAPTESLLAAHVAESFLSGQFVQSTGPAPAPDPKAAGSLSAAPSGHATGLEIGPAYRGQSAAPYFRSVARLGLQVAEALDYAHRQGILHRDIKPSNLLLDTAGTVWVTDFGLAKSAEGEVLTQSGDIVGTVPYMAPERFHGRSDPRSDVYSLGLTLYELLMLRPAFEDSDAARLMERVQRENPPAPRKIDQRIPRDLDTIVRKAIAKNPSERYPTAEALAEDLGRFLADRPIQARPVNSVERLWRWCRRNPAVASLTAAAALFLLAGTAISSYFAFRANQNAAAEAKRRQNAREALDMLSSDVIDEWLAKQNRLLPEHRRFLEKALGLYEELAHDTARDEASRAGVARAQRRVADIRKRLGQTAEAETAYLRSRQLYKHLVADFPTVPGYRLDLARGCNRLGGLLSDTGRLQDAKHAYRDALTILKQLVADSPADPLYRRTLAVSLMDLGNVLAATGEAQAAEDAYGDALKLRQQLVVDFPSVPEYRKELALSHNNLGVLLQRLGRAQDAARAHRDAVELYRHLAAEFPAEHEYREELAASQNNLGALLMSSGRAQEAESAHRDALKLLRQLTVEFPAVPRYRQSLAGSYLNLSILLTSIGRAADAEAAGRDALKLYQQLADDFPTVPEYRQELALSQNSVGNLLQAASRPQEAERAFRDALRLQRQLTADFPTVPAYRKELARTQINLGVLLAATGQAQEAESAYREALKLQHQLVADFPAVPDYHNDLAATMLNLADLLRGSKEPGLARQLLEQAVPHHHAALQADPRNAFYRQCFSVNRLNLAEALVDLGEHAAAADAAAQLIQAAFDAAGDNYAAACIFARCVRLAGRDSHLSEVQRKERAQHYAGRALSALRQAVQSGYKDVTHIKNNKDLNPLRACEVFQKLLSELEGDGENAK